MSLSNDHDIHAPQKGFCGPCDLNVSFHPFSFGFLAVQV